MLVVTLRTSLPGSDLGCDSITLALGSDADEQLSGPAGLQRSADVPGPLRAGSWEDLRLDPCQGGFCGCALRLDVGSSEGEKLSLVPRLGLEHLEESSLVC